MNAAPAIQHHTADRAATIREELLDLHDAVYEGSGDPLAARDAFAPFLDHWLAARDFVCTVARTPNGTLVGYAYGAPLTAHTSWWDGVTPPLDTAATAENGTRTFALSELLVGRRWRGTGTARRLHDALLHGRPESRVTLLTPADHAKVVDLYESWGYQRVGACVPFPGAPRLAAMLRELSGPTPAPA
ncbi:GNAT family N-acetyltransferase [Streptomyces sp. NPDC057702]|uniref:GNAT family N-acetyltransferase n=1 Tax=unclassified Streptomyces TaxID=2593676 RepID=UPI0036BC5569